MKSIHPTILLTLVMLIFFTSISSCFTNKTSVGAYKETQGAEYTYAKGKQIWLFWGWIPIGRTKMNTPASGDCEVITRFNLADVLISSLTLG